MQYVAIGREPGVTIHIIPIAKILFPLRSRLFRCGLAVTDVIQRLVNNFRLIKRLISEILAQRLVLPVRVGWVPVAKVIITNN